MLGVIELKKGKIGATFVAGLLVAGLASAQDVMLLTEFDGSVQRFNVATHEVQEVNPLAVSSLNGATAGPGGSVYAASFGSNNLYLIDAATGAASFLAAGFDFRGLAYIPSTSTIYAIRDNGGLTNDTLYSINPYTGAQALVGSTGNNALQSLTYGPDGVMYGYSVTGGLGIVNVATGLWTDLNVGQAGLTAIQAIEADSEGIIWGFGNDLYTVNKTTTAHTLVESSVFNSVRGAALLKPNYPVVGSGGTFIYDVSSDTGRGFVFNNFASPDHGSASAPNRRIYFLNGAGTALMYRDPGSAVPTSVGNTGIAGWTAMAFEVGANRMLAIRRNAGVDVLYAINYLTGNETLIGTTGTNTIEGLAGSSTGTVYAWSTTLGLMTINPATGLATDVNGSVGGTSFIRSLDYSPDGRLCGFGNGIWDINAAGRFVRIGGTGYTQLETAVFVPTNGRMRGIEFGGDFWDIFDVSQGNASFIASTLGSNCLTVGPDGNLFGQDALALTQYDPVTGATTSGFNPGFTLTGIASRGTEFYAIRNMAPNDTIYKWEPPLNILTALPMSNVSGLQALATSPNGTLFGWDVNEGLMRIDTTTGQATDVNPAAAGSANIQAIEFLPDFSMYAVRSDYYDMNPATGNVVTFPGAAYTDIRGLAFVGSRVRGVVNLEDYIPSLTSQVVTIEVRHPNTSATIESHPCRLSAAGEFSFTSYRQGTYQLAVKGSHWLRREMASLTTFNFPDATNPAQAVDLENGDIDNDNEVGIGDYSRLSSAYNSSPGDPNWDAASDLNGDEAVDIADYAILSSNYGLIGDE